MGNRNRAWFDVENTYVEVIRHGLYVSRIKYTVEPGMEVDEEVLNEELIFGEEDDDGL
jgi:hypothetical protein